MGKKGRCSRPSPRPASPRPAAAPSPRPTATPRSGASPRPGVAQWDGPAHVQPRQTVQAPQQKASDGRRERVRRKAHDLRPDSGADEQKATGDAHVKGHTTPPRPSSARRSQPQPLVVPRLCRPVSSVPCLSPSERLARHAARDAALSRRFRELDTPGPGAYEVRGLIGSADSGRDGGNTHSSVFLSRTHQRAILQMVATQHISPGQYDAYASTDIAGSASAAAS